MKEWNRSDVSHHCFYISDPTTLLFTFTLGKWERARKSFFPIKARISYFRCKKFLFTQALVFNYLLHRFQHIIHYWASVK